MLLLKSSLFAVNVPLTKPFLQPSIGQKLHRNEAKVARHRRNLIGVCAKVMISQVILLFQHFG